jgi:pimeloyl-[acyl-carrier protein] methyl ester esterase
MSLDLHLETAGHGEPLVLIHGWGLHGGVWQDVTTHLARTWRVICPDLPGHGSSPSPSTPIDLDALTESVAFNSPRRATYIGWSLGGMIAIDLARRHPRRVASLVLVATTPRFVIDAGWRAAVDPSVLDEFGAGLAADYRRTVRDFLALQVRGDSHAVELLRTLRERVFERGEPDAAVLAQCLEVLRTTDLRSSLHSIEAPTLVIAGQHDRLCPAAASRYLAARIPDSRLHVIARASHAPFLSHRQQFEELLQRFLAATTVGSI